VACGRIVVVCVYSGVLLVPFTYYVFLT